MSLKQIEQWKQDRLTENGAWAKDTIDCVIYAMEGRQPCSVLYKKSLESLYEYKRLVEIGCEFLTAHPDKKQADMLLRAVNDDSKTLYQWLYDKMRCDLGYSRHILETIGIFFQCLQMTEECGNAVKHKS